MRNAKQEMGRAIDGKLAEGWRFDFPRPQQAHARIAPMKILLNGSEREFAEPISVAQLLTITGYGGKRVAVEVNLEIVPKSLHAQRLLTAGERVEIVQAIGGG